MAAVNPFPTDTAIRPEERLIGRAGPIDRLYRQVVREGISTLLFAERRVGKTSMALAVLDRVRNDSVGWALEVDLTHGPILNSASLADAITAQARAAGITLKTTKEKLFGLGKQSLASGADLAQVAELLGLDKAADVKLVAETISGLLAPAEQEDQSDLRPVLLALEAAAIGRGDPLVIFLDEIQRLDTDWEQPGDSEDVQTVLSELMRRPDSPVTFLFAGSEERAVDALFRNNAPLSHSGERFEVPPIPREDWIPRLKERFNEVNLKIETEEIGEILDASGGHPQRTMRVCARCRHWCDTTAQKNVSRQIVENGIKDAKEHPNWDG